MGVSNFLRRYDPDQVRGVSSQPCDHRAPPRKRICAKTPKNCSEYVGRSSGCQIKGYRPCAAEVPSLALLDTPAMSPARRLGPTMPRVAPPGIAVRKGGSAGPRRKRRSRRCGSPARQPGRLPHNRSGIGFLVGHASRVPGGWAACGGGAIFNIVGRTNIDVGRVIRANNVEGGSSRELSLIHI